MCLFSIVVATDASGGIGKNGTLPWPKLKGDLRFYRELTCCADRGLVESRFGLAGSHFDRDFDSFKSFRNHLESSVFLPDVDPDRLNAVIMGRKTWESIPDKFRPLPNRLNIVVTRTGLSSPVREQSSVIEARSLNDALTAADDRSAPQVFVVGGGQIYAGAIKDPRCQRLYQTRIDGEFGCDVFFPSRHHAGGQSCCGYRVTEDGISYQFTMACCS